MSATYEGFCEYYDKFLKALEEMYRIASTDAYKGIGSPDPVEFNKYFAQAVEYGRIFHESLFELPGDSESETGR